MPRAKLKNHKWGGTFYCQICGIRKDKAILPCYVQKKLNNSIKINSIKINKTLCQKQNF